MATAGWRADSAVEESLLERGFEFDFFQAVRLLARLQPERKPVGTAARPSEEIVRFHAWQSLAFPASAIDEIKRTPDSEEPPDMTVTFLGLTGIQGTLPVCYTDRMLAGKGAEQEALRAFLDLFNHRSVSLFYRAWQKYRFPVEYEAAGCDGEPDLFTRSLFDFVGLGTAGLRERMHIPDESLLPYAGLAAQRPCSATALRSILRDYFDLPIEIDQCVGSWYELSDADRSYLSDSQERNQLGVGAFLGDRVWDQQARFRIVIGPVSDARFREFLPGRAEVAKLMDLARYLVGRSLAMEVQLILRAEEVPDCRLADEADAPRLGWNCWLKTEPFLEDAKDAVFAYLT